MLRRPNIHRSTVVVALAITAVVLLTNVPGDSTYLSDWGGVYKAEYEHGWPWVFLKRRMFYGFSDPKRPTSLSTPTYGIPWTAGATWKFWQGNAMWKPHPLALFGNVATGLLLIGAVASTWEWRRRRRTRLMQFSLREIVIATAVVAAAFGWWRYKQAEGDREDNLGYAAGNWSYHGPLWLKRLVGESPLTTTFSRIDGVALHVTDNDQFQKTVSGFRSLRYLREVELDNYSLDKDKYVELSFSALQQLDGLRELWLAGFMLTENDVYELEAVSNLEVIRIDNWEEQKPDILVQLIGAMPDCKILNGFPASFH
jgi:hypothetical protein